jgi:hypothetical protein
MRQVADEAGRQPVQPKPLIPSKTSTKGTGEELPDGFFDFNDDDDDPEPAPAAEAKPAGPRREDRFKSKKGKT